MKSLNFHILTLLITIAPFSNSSFASPPRALSIDGVNYSIAEKNGVFNVLPQTSQATITYQDETLPARCDALFSDLNKYRFLIEKCSTHPRPDAACRGLSTSILPALWGINLTRERIPDGIAQAWSLGHLQKAENPSAIRRTIAQSLSIKESDIDILTPQKDSILNLSFEIEAKKDSLYGMLKENPYHVKPMGLVESQDSNSIETQDLLTACSILNGDAQLKISTQTSFFSEIVGKFGRKELWALYRFLKTKLDPSTLTQGEAGILAGYYTAQFLNNAQIKLPHQLAILAASSCFESSQNSDVLTFKSYDKSDDIPTQWLLNNAVVRTNMTLMLKTAEASHDQ